MTWAELKSYQTNSTWRLEAKKRSQEMHNWMQKQRNEEARLEDDNGWDVTDPLAFYEHSQNFAEDLWRAAIDDIRNTWGTGVQIFNTVRLAASNKCEDSAWILLETAIPAAGSALLLLLTPSPGEVLENYLEPKSLRGGGRGPKDSRKVRRRKGRSGRLRRAFPRFPDIDRLIADRLPGRSAVEGRRAGAPTRFLFRGINVADRLLWHWLVYEATTTFISQWGSGLREARFCETTFTSTFLGTIKQGPINDALRYSGPCPAGDPDYLEPPTISNMTCSGSDHINLTDSIGNLINASQGQITVNLTASGDTDFGDPITITLDIVVRDQLGGVIRDDRTTSFQSNPPFTDVTVSATLDVTGGNQIEYRIEIAGFRERNIEAEATCIISAS